MSRHLGLVLHVQQGNGSLFGYFDNPASQVSAHFWCSKTGALEQYVDTDTVAWAEVAGNPDYLSVETEGFDTEALTAPQVDGVARLLAWCQQTYAIPLSGPVAHGQPGLTPHCNPDGTSDPAWGNHSCPGSIRLRQIPSIIAAATPPTPSPAPEADMQTIFQGPSGTQYILSGGKFFTIHNPSTTQSLVAAGWHVAQVDATSAAAWGIG